MTPRTTLRSVLLLTAIATSACTSINPKQPGRYLCTRDGGDDAAQCPGGWRCGFEGFCIDPTVAAAHKCADSATDCTGGWHCGKDSVCYDRTDAGPVACRLEVALDCADGWRCGQNGSCHERDAGAAYECLADSDCEAQWRCGPDGRCVDSTKEALPPTSGAASSTRLSPGIPLGVPDFVEASSSGSVSSCGLALELDTVSMVHGTTFTKWANASSSPITVDFGCDGGSAVNTDVRQLSLSKPPRAIADRGNESFIVEADGGLTRVLYQWGQPLSVSPVAVPFALKAIKSGSAGRNVLVLIGDSQVGTLTSMGQAVQSPSLVPMLQTDGGMATPTLRDADLTNSLSGNPVLIAATDMGLLASVDTGGGFGPWLWAASECARGAVLDTYAVQAMRLGGSRGVAAVRAEPGLKQFYVQAYAVTSFTNMFPQGCLLNSFDNNQLTKATGDCSCEDQGPIATAFSSLQSDGGVQTVLRCGADGGNRTEICYTNEGSGGRKPNLPLTGGPYRPDVRLSVSSNGVAAAADSLGALYRAPADSQATQLVFAPLTLSSVPDVVVGALPQAIVQVPTVYPNGATIYDPVVTAAAYRHTSGLGFGRLAAQQTMLTGVEGRTDLMVVSLPSLGATPYTMLVRDFINSYARLFSLSDEALQAPYHAAWSQLPDGGAATVLSSGDALFAADVSKVPDGGALVQSLDEINAAPHLKFAATPLPRGTITSLTALPAGGQPESSFALGYVVANGRVFRFKADNPVVFRTDEVPIEPAEAVSVWRDGSKARVGYRSGTVYGLPSRVKLAPAIGKGAAALEFTQACGRTYALTDTGLFALEVAAGQTTGNWVQVPLASDDAGVSLSSAKVHSDGRSLAVFRERGLAELVSATACPP